MNSQTCLRIHSLLSALGMTALLGVASPTLQAGDSPPLTPAGRLSGFITELPSAWRGFTNVLTEFEIEALPVSDVVGQLRRTTQDGFDALLPAPSPDPTKSAPVDPTTGQIIASVPESADWGNEAIKFSLKNVTVCEVFNAMNLQFQLNQRPLRWDLTLNGTRPIAVLRVVVPSEVCPAPPPPQTERTRAVIYVGELLKKNTPSGMSLEDLCATLIKVDAETGNDSPRPAISSYEPGDLLIVRGSAEQLDFIRSTLRALQNKMAVDERSKARADSTTLPAMSPELMKRYGLDRAPRPGATNAP